jgi:hypothetical protein
LIDLVLQLRDNLRRKRAIGADEHGASRKEERKKASQLQLLAIQVVEIARVFLYCLVVLVHAYIYEEKEEKKEGRGGRVTNLHHKREGRGGWVGKQLGE